MLLRLALLLLIVAGSLRVEAGTGCVTTCNIVWGNGFLPGGNTLGLLPPLLGATDNVTLTFITGNVSRVALPPTSGGGGLSILNGAPLRLLDAANLYFVAFQAPVGLVANLVFTPPSTYGSAGQAWVALDANGRMGWATLASSANEVLQGGNYFAATMVLGTLDAYTLDVRAGNVSVLHITTRPSVVVRGNGTVATPLRFMDASNTHRVSIKAPDTLAADYTLTLPTALCTTGQALTVADSTGALGCGTIPSVASKITQGGDAFGAAMLVGPSDTQALQLQTNGVVRSIWPSGGGLQVRAGGTLALFTSDNSKSITQQLPTLAASWTFTWPTTAGTSGYALTTDGSGNGAWASFATVATAVVQNGNAFAAAMKIGPTDNNAFQLQSNNVVRLTLAAAGTVTATGTMQAVHFDSTGGSSPTVVVGSGANVGSGATATITGSDHAPIVVFTTGTGPTKTTGTMFTVTFGQAFGCSAPAVTCFPCGLNAADMFTNSQIPYVSARSSTAFTMSSSVNALKALTASAASTLCFIVMC